MSTQSTFTLQQIAATVKQQHPDFGPKKLFKMLREKNIIYKIANSNDNRPHQKYVEAGYLRKHTSSYKNPVSGIERERYKTLVTEKGAGWLIDIIYQELNTATEDKAA